MSEHWSMPVIGANLSFFSRLHFCVFHLLYASVTLLHLKVAQVVYSMHVLCLHIYTGYLVTMQYLLLKFLPTCLTQFNTAFGSCGYFNIPIVRSHAETTNSLAYTYSLILGLA